jgi:hypothetical protein
MTSSEPACRWVFGRRRMPLPPLLRQLAAEETTMAPARRERECPRPRMIETTLHDQIAPRRSSAAACGPCSRRACGIDNVQTGPSLSMMDGSTRAANDSAACDFVEGVAAYTLLGRQQQPEGCGCWPGVNL